MADNISIFKKNGEIKTLTELNLEIPESKFKASYMRDFYKTALLIFKHKNKINKG